jgi:hypothetical protein
MSWAGYRDRVEGEGQMNPLDWKREHQAALLIAAALGAFIFTTLMFHNISGCAGSFIGSTYYYPVFGIDWGPFLARCWFQILIWPFVGAISGAAVIYIRQLMRA